MSNDNTTTERPILFSAPMIRAILAGTKTQTRLIVKPQPEWFPHHGVLAFDDAVNKGIKCPHGIVGDRLWVRETVELVNSTTDYFHDVLYCADGARVPISSIPTLDMDGFNKWLGGEPKHPSIHMPRWASRITLEITDIRVERLQDISEDDAWDEGFASSDPVTARVDVYERGDAIGWFQNLWGSINGDKAGCNWESNPWVWCISFRAVEAIQ
ncbi:MAG: hypothetical protein EBR82_71660 [Caulobacteraceae bacterium]|nr:hypothetical protein [Caulobacteraceae bacterium]